MILTLIFALISLVLGLVYAAPPSSTVPSYNPADLGENCFSLTYPVNGTVWNIYQNYDITWNINGECQGDYYIYMIPASKGDNGQYSLGYPQQSSLTVDLSLGNAIIVLSQSNYPGEYVFAISKESTENLDSTDYAIIQVV
ncbi:hypothetical protein CLU79DRAFT_761705 [Phycomyces nitens]|nr:hypothetical protein CLU79DRAFT_761705 [Phycomyces nitens]